MSTKTVIVITGPTASGKTDLAIQVAKHFDTAIISADSRQCFRELNIGVAKPTPAQLEEVKHYFVNSHSIRDEVNAAIFEQLAVQYCEEIFSSRDVAIMCGGTGLYIKAFCEGLDDMPAIPDGIRDRIQMSYRDKGISWLQESLHALDPVFYQSGEMMNPQRMMRALEVIQTTGKSIISYRNQQQKKHGFRILAFALHIPREELYNRINTRVEQMISSGLVEEVKNLLPFQNLNALQTVGYKELFDYLKGLSTLEESIQSIKQHTRHYAKRQETWLKKNKNLIWLEENFQKNILNVFLEVKT